jgi:hypothetical protein
MRYLLLLLTTLLLATPLYAEEAVAAGDEELQPEVTIVRRGNETIEEYRVGGQLYMIKITPSKGAPYYLMDTDGDGSLETRRNDLENPSVVQWRIFTW